MMAVAVVGVALATGCAPAAPTLDVGRVLSVKSMFGSSFKVTTAGPGAIDPKYLEPQQFPEGVTFEPADCVDNALPSGLKANTAVVTAEGEGNRFIVIALETSEPVPFDAAEVDRCRHVTFSSATVRGVVDVVDAPQIEGAETVGKHQVVQTAAGGGELYKYVAYLGNHRVIVTADPLIAPNQPGAPVNVQRAQQLLTDAVAAIRG